MSPSSPGKCLSHHQELLNSITSLKKLYDYGPFLEKLKQISPLVDIIDMKSFLKLTIYPLEKKLFMLESPLLNKKMTLKDKSNLSNINITITKLLKILDQDLTLKDLDFSPLWSKSFKEISNRLSLPILTELQELDSLLFKKYVDTSIQNLPFSQIKKINPQKKNLQKTSSPLLPSTPLNSTECVSIKYSRKIRIYPTLEQKIFFEKCFGANRYIYNKTIHYFNNLNENEKKSYSLSKVRPLIMKNNKDLQDDDPECWLKSIPYDTRQLSIKSAISGIKGCFEQIKKGLIKKFNLSFKSKRNKRQIFHIDHRAIKNLKLFPSLLKENSQLKVKNKYKCYENYIPDSDCILQKDGKYYYLLIPKEKKFKPIQQKKDMISLDPGIRTFQSFYTPDGYVGDLGNSEYKEKLLKKEKLIDKLKSLISKETNKRKKKIWKERCDKLKTKVCNIVKDFQWKISSFL